MFVTTHPVPGSVIESMRACPIEFYLTGSRRFGPVRPTSDYDFFTQDTPTIRQALLDMGFRRREAPGYEPHMRDAALVDVFTHARDRVDVQIRKSAEEFEMVCKVIELICVRPPANKVDRQTFWNGLITAVRSSRKLGQPTDWRLITT